MNTLIRIVVLALTLLPAQSTRTLTPDPPIACSSCDAWNADVAPFKIYGNAYFVGTAQLSSVIVTSTDGHILIDAGLPQSAALIDTHIRALGFRTEDIKLILTSHAHFDHVGGVAALQRFTHARVAASRSSAAAFREGRPTADDPQRTIPDNGFPKIADVQVITDNDVLTVGDLRLTARFTPGHTPGSTSWTWRSCEGAACKDLVYADSLNAVSADEFRFTGNASYPSRVDAFYRSIATVASLPCDVIVPVHPTSAMLQKQFAGVTCRGYAENAKAALDKRVADEKRDR